MTEELLVKHCSPTLSGLKTGNIFSCPHVNREILIAEIRRINKCLESKGLRLIPLKKLKKRTLLYLYRPSKLKEDLSKEEVYQILKEKGYKNTHCSRCIVELIKKMNEEEEFPHEIGLFLGYPPEDVKGFIENKASNCKCIGCWKVYGDEKKAQKTFDSYKRCTEICCAQWKNGVSLESLTVAS